MHHVGSLYILTYGARKLKHKKLILPLSYNIYIWCNTVKEEKRIRLHVIHSRKDYFGTPYRPCGSWSYCNVILISSPLDLHRHLNIHFVNTLQIACCLIDCPSFHAIKGKKCTKIIACYLTTTSKRAHRMSGVKADTVLTWQYMAVIGQFHISADFVNKNLQYPLRRRLLCSERGDKRISAFIENRNRTVQTTVRVNTCTVRLYLFCTMNQQMHNYFTDYHTPPTCFDTVESPSGSS